MPHRYRAVIITVAFLLIACFLLGFSYSRQKAARSSSGMTQDQWMQDLDFLATELPRKHKNLYHNISEAEFQWIRMKYWLV
jgi:hypothetical protein